MVVWELSAPTPPFGNLNSYYWGCINILLSRNCSRDSRNHWTCRFDEYERCGTQGVDCGNYRRSCRDSDLVPGLDGTILALFVRDSTLKAGVKIS